MVQEPSVDVRVSWRSRSSGWCQRRLRAANRLIRHRLLAYVVISFAVAGGFETANRQTFTIRADHCMALVEVNKRLIRLGEDPVQLKGCDRYLLRKK